MWDIEYYATYSKEESSYALKLFICQKSRMQLCIQFKINKISILKINKSKSWHIIIYSTTNNNLSISQ